MAKIDWDDREHGWKSRLVLSLIEAHPNKIYRELADLIEEKTGEKVTETTIAKIKHKYKSRAEESGVVETPPDLLTPATSPGGRAPRGSRLSGSRLSSERFAEFLQMIRESGMPIDRLGELIDKINPILQVAGSWENFVAFTRMADEFDLPRTSH
jgi:hypothetical protein